MAAAEGPARGRGAARVWTTIKDGVLEFLMSKAELAARKLHLGNVSPNKKSVKCTHRHLGCNYTIRFVRDPVSGTWSEQELDKNDPRGGYHSNHPHGDDDDDDHDGEEDDHDDGHAKERRGLSDETKAWVASIIDKGYTTTKSIENQMLKEKKSDAHGDLPPIPLLSKLHTWLRHYKKGPGATPAALVIGKKPTPESVKDYAAFMSKASQELRSGNELGPDECFVVAFEQDLSKPNDAKFRLVLSTDRLLQLPVIHEGVISPYAQVIANDDTGSFNSHGWPVILTGCNDGNRTFHATAVSVCTQKSASDYLFVNLSLLKAQAELSTVPPNHIAPLADGADPVASSEEEDAEGDDGEGQAE